MISPYIWLSLGIVLIGISVILFTTDWFVPSDKRETLSVRTFDDLQQNIVFYGSGKGLDVNTPTEWPSDVGVHTASINTASDLYRVEVDSSVARPFVRRTVGTSYIEVWIELELTANLESPFYSSPADFPGFTSAYILTHTDATEVGEVDSIALLRFRDNTVNFATMEVRRNKFVFEFRMWNPALNDGAGGYQWQYLGLQQGTDYLTPGNHYVVFAMVYPPVNAVTDPYQCRYRILNVDAGFTEVMDSGKIDIPFSTGHTFIPSDQRSRYGWTGHSGFHYHTVMMFDTALDDPDFIPVAEAMHRDSILPFLDYGGLMTFYNAQVVGGVTPETGNNPLGTLTVVSGSIGELNINTEGTLSGTINQVTNESVSVTLQIGSETYNTATFTYEVKEQPRLVYTENLVEATIGVPFTFVPDHLLHVNLTGVTTLPSGLQLALEDGENGVTKGMIYGTPLETTAPTQYTVQFALPTLVGDSSTISPTSDTQPIFNLAVRAVQSETTVEDVVLFDYRTTQDEPLICFIGYMDRYWNGRYNVFGPIQSDNFSQFNATMPAGITLDMETGDVLGQPEGPEGEYTIHVYATHKVSREIYSTLLYLEVKETLSVLSYQSKYIALKDQPLVIEPEERRGTAMEIKLDGDWPDSTEYELDGTINIPAGAISSSLNGLRVNAITGTGTIQSDLSIELGYETDNTLRYAIGGCTLTAGAGCTVYGIYQLSTHNPI
jgi:hypothetical protein